MTILLLSGSVTGGVASISVMLFMASTYEGGLSKFFINTSQDYTLLAATCSGFLVSSIICVAVSLCTSNVKTDDDVEQEWAKTINIDNPINPFRRLYVKELTKVGSGDVITAQTMNKVFRRAWLYAIVGSGSGLVFFLVIIPSITLSLEVLSLSQFTVWLRTFQIACFVFTILAVVFPPIEEGYQIWKQYKLNRQNSEALQIRTRL